MLSVFIAIPAVEARSLQGYNIKITKDTVSCTGRCTCSLQTNYAYQTRSFVNYCPNCHRKGTIRYEVGKCSQNVEGMWYCSRCDMDFCLVHGKSHDRRGRYLSKAKTVKSSSAVVGKKPPNELLNIAKNGIKNMGEDGIIRVKAVGVPIVNIVGGITGKNIIPTSKEFKLFKGFYYP